MLQKGYVQIKQVKKCFYGIYISKIRISLYKSQLAYDNDAGFKKILKLNKKNGTDIKFKKEYLDTKESALDPYLTVWEDWDTYRFDSNKASDKLTSGGSTIYWSSGSKSY